MDWEESRWLLRVQDAGWAVLKTLVASLTRRSPCAASAPAYQARKNAP